MHQSGAPGFDLSTSNAWDARFEERLQVVTGQVVASLVFSRCGLLR